MDATAIILMQGASDALVIPVGAALVIERVVYYIFSRRNGRRYATRDDIVELRKDIRELRKHLLDK